MCRKVKWLFHLALSIKRILSIAIVQSEVEFSCNNEALEKFLILVAKLCKNAIHLRAVQSTVVNNILLFM